jgi:serine O-acetyltransferase
VFRQEKNEFVEQVWRDIRARHPRFGRAVLADAIITAGNRGERNEFRSKLDAAIQVIRLCWMSDAFFATVMYRAKAAMQRRGTPLLPRICHKLAMSSAQVSIGDPVIIEPGMYIVHGQIVLDGLVEIGPGAVISPWVSIGLKAGNVNGPIIGRDVRVGSGAKLLGPMKIGDGASIGANAVVTRDVEPWTTVVGIPAAEIRPRQPA